MNLTWLGICHLLRNALNLTWLCTKASWNLPRNLLRNLFRNPVEPDLALHQSRPFPEPSPEICWTWPGSAPKLLRPSPEPSPEPCWTWPGACTSAHRSYSGLKTPLAYAVGGNLSLALLRMFDSFQHMTWDLQVHVGTSCKRRQPPLQRRITISNQSFLGTSVR